MKLMTKELEKKFEQYGERSQEGKEKEAIVAVKYFNPFGSGTWLITEGTRQEDGDYLFFGLCHITDWKWGFVRLSELESLCFIERNLYLSPSATIAEALLQLGITEV